MIGWWNEIHFAYPWAFVLLLLPIALGIWYYLRYDRRQAELRLSNLDAFGPQRNVKALLKRYHPILGLLGLCFLVAALARPQSRFQEEEINTEGIDIVLAMDVSSSMLAKDFEPNRLEASKLVGTEFIDNRPNDRIGLVVFSGESFSQCPITSDHAVVKNQLSKVRQGLLEDGTAIGMGLATAVNRMRDSEAKSKVVILLTDGVNNSGFIDPATAADAALQFGVRCYTVGVGTQGQALSPVAVDASGQFVFRYVDVEIDEELLKEVAAKTGGRYFRATSQEALREIYSEIDQMEKTKIEITAFMRETEEFHVFAFIAAVLFLLEFLLNQTLLRSIP